MIAFYSSIASILSLTRRAAVAGIVTTALLTPAMAQTPSPASKTATVMDYVTYSNLRIARISPDGKFLALVVPRDDKESLMIVDAATMESKAGFDTRVNNKINNLYWANEERIVFDTVYNASDWDQLYTDGEIYAINVDNTKKFVIARPRSGEPYLYSIADTLDDDHDHILLKRWDLGNKSQVRSRPSILKVDIYKEPKDLISDRLTPGNAGEESFGPFSWGDIYTDNNGNIRLATATSEEGKLQVKIRQNDQWQEISNFLDTDKDIGANLGQPLGFNRNNDGIYFLSVSPQGTVGVSLFDIASREIKLLYADDKYDVSPRNLVRSTDGKDLIGVTIMGERPERHYFADNADVALQKSLDKALPGYYIDFINFTQDGRKGLALVSSPTVPPALFLLNRDTGSFKPLFSSRPKLQGTPMTKAEQLTIDTRDGTKVDAYLTKAAGVQGPAPLVVLIHGGPHGIRDEADFDPEVKLLASRGYSVLQVNYRGSGGYGVSFQKAGYRHWGTTMIDDIIDATRYVADKGLVKADQICAMGASYGGYAAMMAIARYPDQFKCGIGISGVYDLNLMRKSDVPFFPGGKDYLERVIGSDEKDLDTNSPVKLASAIKVPVFLAHGGEDKRAPVQNAEAFKKALDAAHVKYEWLYVPSGGHGFTLPANREKLYTDVLTFLGKNLH
ncbi:MAG TPA: S9 family peptidase [Candidatus Acidoferrum sp.]|nr:S9 family peptidase [Candidatus Acidoferrum sp.]